MPSEAENILAVDLDGTLVRTDLLFETFWTAVGTNWRGAVRSVCGAFLGRAVLKRRLAEVADVDVASLPYDTGVVELVRTRRAAGQRTALVTATDEIIAAKISDHLGIFDEVHGSNGDRNLKGSTKSEFLQSRFGDKRFDYVGDSRADLAVWAHARRSITVNAPRKLREAAEGVSSEVEHLETRTVSLSPYLKALRPHQWLKNTLVFLPMLAGQAFDWQTILLSLLAFVSFCLVASSVYVLNDLLDLAADREHPRKRYRPFASGRIPIASGSWMAGGLLLIGMAVAALIGPMFLLVMLGYSLLTTGYSVHLKRRMVIDICVLAGLYTTRIVAGGAATGIGLSVWLLAFSTFFFLSLAAVKRQAELVDSLKRGSLRASGRGYHVDDLPIISMIAISSGYVSVLVMALYVNSPAVVELYNRPEALWGVCAFLLYWITRTVMQAHRGRMHDDPVVYAAKDRVSQICFLAILGFVLAGAIT